MAFEMSSKSRQTNDIGPGACVLGSHDISSFIIFSLSFPPFLFYHESLCRFIGPASHRCDWPSILQCFGSTAERRGWNRPKHLPFVEPTSSSAPGPGSYGSLNSSFRSQLQKRLTDDPIAFGSTDVRPCLKSNFSIESGFQKHSTPATGPDPGPGDYDLKNVSLANMIKKKTMGRHGIFGTCTARFDPHCLPPEIAKLLQYKSLNPAGVDTPGPDTYEISSTMQELSKLKARNVYTFRSGLERFGTQEYDTRAPDVLQIGSRQRPSVGTFSVPEPS